MLASHRPKYLNLLRIRLPIPGLVSILHRVSGFAMFLFAWALLWMLQSLLQSPQSFAQVRAFADHWLVKLFLIGMLWSFLHHFFAGLRFLLLDVHVAGELESTRRMSWAVLALGFGGTALLGAWLW